MREPPGTQQGRVQAKLSVLVGGFVYSHTLGALFGQDTGFRIAADPDTVRAPDLAFVRHDRLALIAPRGYAALAPDLVAEILSPDDRPGDVLAKIGEWLSAGVEIAWLIDPQRRNSPGVPLRRQRRSVAPDGALEGDSVMPGLSVRLAELFE